MLIQAEEFAEALERKIKQRLETIVAEMAKGKPQDSYHQLCGAHRELSMYVPDMLDEVLRTYREPEENENG